MYETGHISYRLFPKQIIWPTKALFVFRYQDRPTAINEIVPADMSVPIARRSIRWNIRSKYMEDNGGDPEPPHTKASSLLALLVLPRPPVLRACGRHGIKKAKHLHVYVSMRTEASWWDEAQGIRLARE